MEKNFQLLLSIRTLRGFEVCGEFSLGSDQIVAKEIFDALHGSPVLRPSSCIHIDFVEMAGDVPAKVETMYCTLEDWCANSKLIIKALFRLKNLEECL